MNLDKNLKLLTTIFFFGFLFIVPIINIFTPDKKVSEIENKILTPLPKLSVDTILDKSFMTNFDKYTSDHFPRREDFIELKNTYNYALGNREFRNIYISSNSRLMEKFSTNNETIDENILKITNISKSIYDNYKITSKLMVVPTSIAFYNDELPSFAITDNQVDVLDYIAKNIPNLEYSMSDSTSFMDFYTPYNALNRYKDMPIYFNTDHHWTQLGARIAYEDMYNKTLPSTKLLQDNYAMVADDFYGTYYSKALLPQVNGDLIYAYSNYNDFNIAIDFDKEFDTLYSPSKLDGKNKYQYFLHGDPAIAVIDGNKNLDGEILIFKDSYAHSFIPFLTSNYKKIHVIDPRYYNANIDDYLKSNKDISEVLFLFNLHTFNSMDIFKYL